MKKNGFSIVSALVGLAIVGLLASVLGTIIVDSVKTQSNVRDKAAVADMKAMLQMALVKAENCSQILNIGTIPIIFSGITTPTPGTTNNPNVFLQGIILAGSIWKPGVKWGNLQIDTISLNLGNPLTPTSQDFLGTLSIMVRDRSKQSMVRAVPLLLNTKVGSTPGTRTVVGCQQVSSEDTEPVETCRKLGGRWLSGPFMSTSTGTPTPRCHLGRDIVLSRNEAYGESAPGAGDGVPLMGGSNAVGERVTTCYRQLTSNSRISPYQCSSRSGNRSGERCAYDPNSRLWGVYRFNSQGVMGTRVSVCEKGVEITTRPSDSEILNAHQDATEAYGDAVGTDGQPFVQANPAPIDIARELALMEHRTGATRCKTNPDLDTWTACSNLSNPSTGLEGQINSCIFVRNVRLSSDFQTLISRHNTVNCPAGGDCVLNQSNYTGWIRVSSPRRVTSTGIQEATGRPCSQVDFNPATTPQPYREVFSGPSVAENNAALQNPGSIARCNLRRNKIHPVPMPTGSLAQNFQVFQCNNSEIDTSSVDTFTGNSSDDKPSINKGSCWYVKGIRLTNSGPAHTGWVYIQEDIPPNRYQAENHAQGEYALKYKGSVRTLKALACDDGVSLQKEGQ